MGSGAAAAATAAAREGAEPEKMFKCPTCARVFNKKANLKVHSRKHTGEKPYACSKPGCGRAFMWKSSVTFHEQNCPSVKKQGANANASVPVSSQSKGVQKRPKSSARAAADAAMHVAGAAMAGGKSAHSGRTPPKGVGGGKGRASRKSEAQTQPMNGTLPGTPLTPEEAVVREPKPIRDDISLSATAASTSPTNRQALTDNIGIHFATSPMPQSMGFPTSSPLPQSVPFPATSPQPPLFATSSAQQHFPTSSPLPQDYQSSLSQSQSFPTSTPSQGFATSAPQSQNIPASAPLSQQLFVNSASSPAPPPQQQGANPTDGHQLPAPSTLLGEKRVQSGGGRPPVIPGSLPKHFYGLQAGHKENTTGTKPLFDLRVPASTNPPLSGNKPPVMYNNKMPKMPIAMELDDSDDEGPVKIMGAQDAFMRTGNPFGGFAPPTRCSPLPVSSPIVCPGISPMPLSPLAPFSPLPPDSPAHNAPNPVHPPLNQPTIRPSTNTNW